MWTSDQRKHFSKFLAITAKLYDKTLDFDVCQMIVDDLVDLDYDSCMDALLRFRKDQKNKTWPRAADIRNLVSPTLDSDTKGKLAASRVIESVSKFGYTNPEEAKNYIGELGWKAVQRFGGWQYICENLGLSIQISTFQAQIRDVAIATDKAGHIGMQDTPIGITAPKETPQLSGGLQKVDPMKLIGVKSE